MEKPLARRLGNRKEKKTKGTGLYYASNKRQWACEKLMRRGATFSSSFVEDTYHARSVEPNLKDSTREALGYRSQSFSFSSSHVVFLLLFFRAKPSSTL